MWFIWIMWVIVALAITATIILLTGKGSMLVSGFNTKSPEERAKYDKKKVSKQAGSIMVFVDIGLLALTSYIHFRAIPAIPASTRLSCRHWQSGCMENSGRSKTVFPFYLLKTACIHRMQFTGLGAPNKRFATQNKQMYIRLHCLRVL